VPESVRAADKLFRESNDLVAQFLAEKTEAHPSYRVHVGVLYTAYTAWCARSGIHSESRPAVSTALERLGFGRLLSGGYTDWLGFKLISPGQPNLQPAIKKKRNRKKNPTSPTAPLT
jgi:hypothetical protein